MLILLYFYFSKILDACKSIFTLQVPRVSQFKRSSSGEMAQVRRSVGEALWAMCAADSMSMPVHWYYDIHDISRDFGGWISGFNSPRNRHPSSILSLSNTSKKTFSGAWKFWKVLESSALWSFIASCCADAVINVHIYSEHSVCVAAGSGRTAWSSGAKRPDVVGNVILHDKLNLWKSSKGSVHYHQGTDWELILRNTKGNSIITKYYY